MLEVRHPFGQRQQLVDLLFILGEHQSGFAIAEQIGGFLVEHVAIKPEAHGADRVAGDFGRDPVRAVVADNADDVTTAKSEFDHAEREIMDPRLIVVPGEFAPEPEILFTQGGFAAMFARIEAQQLRIGIGLRGPAGIIHHAALSAFTGASSGPTRSSSSSPR